MMSPTDLLDELIALNDPQPIRCFYLPPRLYAELLEELGLDEEDHFHILHQGIPVVKDPKLPEGVIEPVCIPDRLPLWACRGSASTSEDHEG